MIHLTDLQCSMYCDNAVIPAESAVITQHLESCTLCRTRVAQFLDEKQLISAALETEAADLVAIPELPRFSNPVRIRDFAIANVLTGVVVWLAQFVWKTLFGELVMDGLSWITSIFIPDLFSLFVTTALYFTQVGTTMIDTYSVYVVVCLLILTLAWFVIWYRKAHATISLCILATLCLSILNPPSVNALELRYDKKMVTIAAAETIDDTLVIAAETVVIDGTINGDLIAVGQRIVINGPVAGNLVAFGESISVSSHIEGFTLGAASSVGLNDAVITGDLWAAAGDVNINRASRIGSNSTIAAETASIAGHIKRDLWAFGDTVELSGEVGEDLEVFSNGVNLLGDASVGGNLRFRTNDETNLQRSSTATIGGKIEILPLSADLQPINKYTTGRFYVVELISLVSALIAGIALLWLIPGLRYLSLSGGITGLKNAGIGLVALISLPFILLLCAITLVGLPFTVIGFFVWLTTIYFAKIVVASVIGRMLLSSSEKWDSLPLTLLAGLVTIFFAVNLPWIGGIISFVLTIVGIGLIVQRVLHYTSNLDANPAT